MNEEKVKAFEQYYADCTECKHSKQMRDHLSCVVKSIDCSVREGRRPCTKFEVKE